MNIILPRRLKKGVRGDSATRAARKKNANTTDEEQHHKEEPIRGVTHHVTHPEDPEDPNKDVPTMDVRETLK